MPVLYIRSGKNVVQVYRVAGNYDGHTTSIRCFLAVYYHDLLQYYGYLMTERSHTAHMRTTFECVDFEAETTSGGQGDQSGGRFYHVEPRCGNLPCPPHEEEKEMTCVVCTR